MATYNLKLTWNPPAECWMADLSDEDGNALIAGFSLVTGSDLIEQFEYLGIGGQLICQTDSNRDAVPTFENLGRQSHFFFLTP